MPRFTSLANAAFTLSLASPSIAGLVVVNYVGPDGGLWNTAANWSPAQVPNDNLGDTFEAIVDPPRPRTVNMAANIALTGLSIGDGDAVVVSNGVTFDYNGGSLFNSGALILNSTGVNTSFRVNAPLLQLVAIDAGGELRLAGGPAARIFGGGGTRRLENEPTHAIRGAGSLGLNTLLNLTNDGVIEGDTPGSTLTIDLVGTTADNFNHNRIASVGGDLTVNGTELDNTAGDIVSEAGTLRIVGSSTILGGMVRSTGGDLIVGAGSILDSVSTSGTLSILNGNGVTLRNTLVNDGTVQLQSTGVNTDLLLATDVTIAGTGVVSLSSFAANRIFGVGAPRRLDIADTQEVRGSGQFGANSNMVLTNNGTITANQPVTLTVDLAGTIADNFNPGVMRAQDGATLTINGTQLDNTMGTIRAETASRVVISVSTIANGIIESLGESLGVDLQSGSRIVDMALAAAARVPNGSALFVQGPVENIGTLTLDSVGVNTDLILESDVLFHGGGELIGTLPSSRVFGTGSIRRLTNHEDHTIRGAGNLGANTNLELTNDGEITADIAGGTLTIDLLGAASDNVNNGTLRAETGATLTLNAPGIDNTFGDIVADGGIVRLNAADVIGGQLASFGGGELQVQSMASIDGVTLDGTLRVPNGTNLECAGTIINGGTIHLDSAGVNTHLTLTSDVDMTGVGEIALSSAAANRILGAGGQRRLTLGIDQLLHGSGNIGVNTQFSLTNLGSIVADGAQPLTIDVSGDYQNVGLLESLVSNITISPGAFTNFGTVIVNPGRTITRSGVYDQDGGMTEVNGTLTTTSTTLDGGVLSGGGTVSGPITNSFGTLAPGNPVGPLTTTSTYAQGAGGVLAVAVTGPMPANIDRLTVSGTATLAGTLQVNRAGAFIPLPTDEFTILSCANRVGTFDTVSSCEPVDVVYTPTEVRVRFTNATGIPGDLNGDGVVNGADLGLMLGGWGICADLCCPGDLNGDGVIDGADLGILLGAWT